MLRLQGFPDTFKINVPYTQIRKIAGNSVSVKVIELIAEEIKKAIETNRPQQTHKQLQLEKLLDGTYNS
jgi:DNA (cytosine-5)-methyltransferase 1